MKSSHSERGSVLVLCLGMLTVLALMAAAFVSSVQLYRDTGRSIQAGTLVRRGAIRGFEEARTELAAGTFPTASGLFHSDSMGTVGAAGWNDNLQAVPTSATVALSWQTDCVNYYKNATTTDTVPAAVATGFYHLKTTARLTRSGDTLATAICDFMVATTITPAVVDDPLTPEDETAAESASAVLLWRRFR